MATYRVGLDYEAWLEVVAQAVDKGKDLFHLQCKDMKLFTEKILGKEKPPVPFEIKYIARRLYKTPIRTDTPYVTINGNCKGENCGCKYKIVREHEPDVNQPTVVFEVTRIGDHKNHEPITEVRGAEKRKNVAEDMILTSNGSAQDYVLKKIAKGEPHASEEVFSCLKTLKYEV